MTSVITGDRHLHRARRLKRARGAVLAIIAGLFDFIPVVGFILSLVLTALLAATVSTNVLWCVVAFYVVFNAHRELLHCPEDLRPRAASSRSWRCSSRWLSAASSGGVMGALLALPIAAVYPTIERLWLRDHLVSDTVEIHKRLSA